MARLATSCKSAATRGDLCGGRGGRVSAARVYDFLVHTQWVCLGEAILLDD
jgi:hypothetical protein